MPPSDPPVQRHGPAVSWADAQSRDALQLIVETVSELTGFDLVGVSVVREDGYVQGLAMVGPEEAVASEIGAIAPVGPLLEALETAEDWGLFRFLPARTHALDLDRWGWRSAEAGGPAPDAWQPDDLLLAPFHDDEDGRLVGFLGLDLPRSGSRPDAAERQVLQIHARHARASVLNVLARERLAELVRLTDAAADVLRNGADTRTPQHVIDTGRDRIRRALRADRLWFALQPEAAVLGPDGPDEPPPPIAALTTHAADRAWAARQAFVVAPRRPAPRDLALDPDVVAAALESGPDVGSLLVAPLGVLGDGCAGAMVLSRLPTGAEWSPAEVGAAFDIGRDLGLLIHNAGLATREQALLDELRTVAAYKGRLMAMVSHELKNPLTAILGHLEILASDPELSEDAHLSVGAMQRGGQRLQRAVNDLQLLYSTDSPEPADPRPVDLVALVGEAVELYDANARRAQVVLRIEESDELLVCLGDAVAIERAVANLLSNAIKYTPAGGSVTLRVARHRDGVEVACRDTGIGIAEEDRDRIFEEFYRTANPLALDQPGTGLGLAIVSRIVQRHGGRVEVESVVGAGSTFRLVLPAGGPAAHAPQPEAREVLLFTYGTFRLAEVQLRIFGRTVRGEPDAITSHRLVQVRVADGSAADLAGSDVHPALVPSAAGGLVRGVALQISDDELALALAHESRDHHLVEVELASGRRAWATTVAVPTP
ncbi:HAMP domain-containing sensor histidine kinase [Nocardioides sp. W7]|uniref:sensor histidine kinase n=1 Tax=Nocardioides sp. W7 TaxID=2931390 RepID=UPI001FD39E25|nr:HAMP domain-containing sensor histidine kinase [Nocardioides sp. W7]